MIKDVIAKVVDKIDLTESEMMSVVDQMTDGLVTQAQIGAFLIGLRMKGETIDEIVGAAKVMRSKCIAIQWGQSNVSLDRDEINLEKETIVDTCGTGGDGTKTFNISTTTAFVVAGTGLKVAKHGNRSVSSICGSADVIEALGVNINMSPEKVAMCIDKIGIGFLYAPILHGAMRHVIGPRKEIGLRTIFNLLGPLTNPAKANVQVIGVYHPDLTEKIAGVLKKLDCRSAFVVHGQECYDEISITGPSKVTRLYKGEIATSIIYPEDFGMKRAKPEDIVGGDAAKNANIVHSILSGKMTGPCRDIVLLNAAAVFVASEKASTMEEGIKIASESIDSGCALKKLQQLIEVK